MRRGAAYGGFSDGWPALRMANQNIRIVIGRFPSGIVKITLVQCLIIKKKYLYL